MATLPGVGSFSPCNFSVCFKKNFFFSSSSSYNFHVPVLTQKKIFFKDILGFAEYSFAKIQPFASSKLDCDRIGSNWYHVINIEPEMYLDMKERLTKYMIARGYKKQAEVFSKHPGVLPFTYHSDCDGEWHWKECELIADMLEKIKTALPEEEDHYFGNWKVVAQKMIDGLWNCSKHKVSAHFC